MSKLFSYETFNKQSQVIPDNYLSFKCYDYASGRLIYSGTGQYIAGMLGVNSNAIRTAASKVLKNGKRASTKDRKGNKYYIICSKGENPNIRTHQIV